MVRKKDHKRELLLKLALVCLILLLFAGTVTAFFPTLLFPKLPGPAKTAAGEEQESFSGAIPDRLRGDTVNIALLGFDRSAWRDKRYSMYRPDTILIAAFNFRSGQVSLVSIPRDSYVKIHGTATHDKINHSYMYGYYRALEGENPHDIGIRNTLATVTDFLGGVPLHGYIVIDMDGAEDIVDSVGGLYYDVDVTVRDDFGRGRLLVEEGYQLLDGRKFMDYVRNRASFQGGERGRTERQQKIMIAFLKQLKEIRNWPRLPLLYLATAGNTETNLNIFQALALGLFGLQISPEEIETAVFSGRGQLSYRNGQNIWYLVIDEEERVKIIKMIFGMAVERRAQITLPGPVTAELEEPEPEPAPDLIEEDELEDPAVDDPVEEEPVEEDPPQEEPVEDEPVDEEPKENESDPEEPVDPEEPEEPEENEDQGQ